MKHIKLLLVLLPLTLLLQACLATAIIVGGAVIGVAASSVVYDQRSYSTSKQDREISKNIIAQIKTNEQIHQQCRIVINTYNGWVLMAGQCPTQNLKANAEKMAGGVDNIKRLYNEISIRPPIGNSVRSKDTWITTKAKSSLLAHQGLKFSQISVTTENSVIYLQGIVTKAQGEAAAKVVSKIDGVSKVVTLFQYLAPKNQPA